MAEIFYMEIYTITKPLNQNKMFVKLSPTKQQLEELESCYTGLSFACPSCKSNGGQHPHIENPGETYTQIYCVYCREYVEL